MRKGLSIVMVVVTAGVIVLVLGLFLIYISEESIARIRLFQEESEECNVRGGRCISRSRCESEYEMKGKCQRFKVKTADNGGLQSIEREKVCCYPEGVEGSSE